MLKFFSIILLLIGCKKHKDFSQTEFQSEIILPTCEEDPMFCDDDLDALPEADIDVPEEDMR